MAGTGGRKRRRQKGLFRGYVKNQLLLSYETEMLSSDARAKEGSATADSYNKM